MKYQEWLNVWLEHYVQPTAKSKTYEHYKYLSESHILPKLGSMELTEITVMEMQRLVSELLREGNRSTGKGLASSTVNTIITVLQSSFGTARFPLFQNLRTKFSHHQADSRKNRRLGRFG